MSVLSHFLVASRVTLHLISVSFSPPQVNFEMVVHADAIRQAAKVVMLTGVLMNPGDRARATLSFVYHPEYITRSTLILLRGGSCCGVGRVLRTSKPVVKPLSTAVATAEVHSVMLPPPPPPPTTSVIPAVDPLHHAWSLPNMSLHMAGSTLLPSPPPPVPSALARAASTGSDEVVEDTFTPLPIPFVVSTKAAKVVVKDAVASAVTTAVELSFSVGTPPPTPSPPEEASEP